MMIKNSSSFYSYLQLLRPANMVTALADILAGAAVANTFFNNSHMIALILLCLSTLGLYAGGIIFNDICDFSEDFKSRPERPLPSGRVSKSIATRLGIDFYVLGVGVSSLVGYSSFVIAISIAIASLAYNMYFKKFTLLGSFNMGICRALNLALGLSIVPQAVITYWPITAIPFALITGVNLLSREEENPVSKNKIHIAILFYIAAFVGLVFFINKEALSLLAYLPVILVLLLTNIYPLYKMIMMLSAENVQEAVKAGILSLILVDAIYSIGLNNWRAGFFILLLLPVTHLLSKLFYVT